MLTTGNIQVTVGWHRIYMRVHEYIKIDGTNPYKEWFDSLDAQAAAKISVAKVVSCQA